MSGAQKWITLVIEHDEIQAQIKKGFLEEAGVECILEPVASHAYNFLNSYKLNVLEHQKDLALTVLSQLDR